MKSKCKVFCIFFLVLFFTNVFLSLFYYLKYIKEEYYLKGIVEAVTYDRQTEDRSYCKLDI